MKTKDNKEVIIGDKVYYAKKRGVLMYIHTQTVSETMKKPVDECYAMKSNAHFLCIAANMLQS